MLGLVGQVGITGRGENRVVAEEFLHFDQIDTRFDQVGGIAVVIFHRNQASWFSA